MSLVIENNKILLYLLRKANKFYKYKLQNSFSKKKITKQFSSLSHLIFKPGLFGLVAEDGHGLNFILQPLK
jgi:hypothetical protein